MDLWIPGLVGNGEKLKPESRKQKLEIRGQGALDRKIEDRVRSGEVEQSGGWKSLWSGGQALEFRIKN
jgi:hypothetical protein